MSDKVSSLDEGYVAGDISVYPEAIDSSDTIYEVKNNAETALQQSLPYTGKYIVVDDASKFPDKGLLRIGPLSTVISLQKGDVFPRNVPGTPGGSEFIYYATKAGNVFKDLIRGFAGSVQSQWPIGTVVGNAVFAEHHNAIKDAVINIENYLGTRYNPATGTLNKILSDLENKFLAPKPSFRAFPKSGKPPLTVTFQNFSSSDVIRYLWDFGDYTTSLEKSPSHTYHTEGIYTVTLNIITSTGAQGIAIKDNYINVSNDYALPFFYTELIGPQTVRFVDQTIGSISQRIWVFGDGDTLSVDDPDIHTATHVYDPGEYHATLMTVFGDQSYRRVASQTIEII